MSVPNGTMLRIVQIRASHDYTDRNGEFYQNPFYWTVNEYAENNNNQFSSDYCPIVNWNYQYYSHYSGAQCGAWFGGWQDFDLRFNMINDVYPDSVFSFTMYYELHPVLGHT